MLAPQNGASFTFANARLLRRIRDFELFGPSDQALVISTAVSGRYRDGWVRPRSLIRAWPTSVGARTGRLELALSLPQNVRRPVRVRITGAGIRREIVVRPGSRVPFAIAFQSPDVLSLTVIARPTIELGSRTVAVLLSRPRLVARPQEG